MPVKMQYPVELAKGTKCPSCNTEIVEIGPRLYSCQTGHILEAVVLVTLRGKRRENPVAVNTIDNEKRTDKGVTTEDVLTPSYDFSNRGKPQ
jgi:hypothetical protein